MQRRVASLRWRLLMGSVVTIGLALLLAGWVLAGLFRDHARDQLDQQLTAQLDQLTASFEADVGPRLRSPLSDPRWTTPFSGLYWQIEQAGTGQVMLRSRSLWDETLALPTEVGLGQQDAGADLQGPQGQPLRVRVRTVRVDAPSAGASEWRLLVAADTLALEAAVAHFARQLALSLGVLGLALALAAWLQVGLGLAPLQPLRRAVQAVRDGQASQLPDHFPAEVAPLVQDFNRVLAQQVQGVERARHLAGNLAHAIKTPLAILTQLIERPDPDPAAQARQLLTQVQAAQQQVDWHLRRARAASGHWAGLRTPVAPVLQGLVRVMRKVHAHRDTRPGLAIHLSTDPEPLAVACESQDLQEMAGNLIDNACKWAHSQVLITLLRDGPTLCIRIDDDGPGLQAGQREAVFARGFRADEHTPGTGLGLAIALELSHLYGGQIDLGQADLGGLRAELRLPALPDTTAPS